MRRLAILFALAAAAFGQSPSQFPSPYNPLAWRYYATYSGTALTVQQPAANNAQVHFEQAVIECAAAQTVTLSWNGAAATSTTAAGGDGLVGVECWHWHGRAGLRRYRRGNVTDRPQPVHDGQRGNGRQLHH